MNPFLRNDFGWARLLFAIGGLLLAVPNLSPAPAVGVDQPYTPPGDMAGTWGFQSDPSLPNVLLLGDSISIAYTRQVGALLKGKANVYRPMRPDGTEPANCGETRMGLQQLDRWLGNQSWAVIHFNWGLWDLCYRNPKSRNQGNRDKVGGTLSVPLPEYEKNLETLVSRLEKTQARLIWATTTIVPEDEAGRFVGDEDRYNRVAAAVMARHRIAVDDLHALTKQFTENRFIAPGDVHFTEEGSAELAAKVAQAIERALPAER